MLKVVTFRHTSLAGQRRRVQQLMDSHMDEVVLHGIGSAVSRTINLALQIQRKLADSLKLEIKTSTVRVGFYMLFLLDLRVQKINYCLFQMFGCKMRIQVLSLFASLKIRYSLAKASLYFNKDKHKCSRQYNVLLDWSHHRYVKMRSFEARSLLYEEVFLEILSFVRSSQLRKFSHYSHH